MTKGIWIRPHPILHLDPPVPRANPFTPATEEIPWPTEDREVEVILAILVVALLTTVGLVAMVLFGGGP